MASHHLYVLFVFLQVILMVSPTVKSDAEDDLLAGINAYRASVNRTAFTENDNAECLADKVADQLEKQPCTNTTGSFTVPGTETQFSNYPDLLEDCHLNISNTKDGIVMPVCVPNLVPGVVLNNYTQTQYSGYLNDSKYTGAGIGKEGNWMVVVLSTNTPEGSFVKDKGAASVSKVGVMSLLLGLVAGFFC